MAMRRNRFNHIMRILHFKDNLQIDLDEKYSKLRPLILSLQKNFMLHFVPDIVLISADVLQTNILT